MCKKLYTYPECAQPYASQSVPLPPSLNITKKIFGTNSKCFYDS